jgi:aldehyde dehydrogenase (NAD+)
MGESFSNFIDGKWVDSAGKTAFDDTTPANKAEVIGSFPRSDHRDIDRAVETARTHCAAWSRVPAVRRGEVFHNAARAVEDRAQDFAALIARETGKVLPHALMETHASVSVLRAVANEVTHLGRVTGPSEHPGDLVVAMTLPLGVAAVVSHWTFPLAGCVWSVSLALAAGNTVVLKPSEDAPLIAVRFAEVLLGAGLPAGALSLVHGYGEEAGAPLVRHPDVDAVLFTGSSEVGREVAIACAAEPKVLVLDVGERSVAVVLDDADLDLAVEGVIAGGLAFSGQRWRGATRIFVQRKVAKECAERLAARAQSLRLGDGLSATTDVGPLINEAQLKRTHGHTRIGVRDGAKLLCGGEVIREGECKRGFFYAPTVFGEATVKMRIVQEDVLGPTCVVVPIASLEEAVEQASIPRRDATAIIFTRDLARGLRAAEGLRAARILVNPALPKPGTPPTWTGFSRLSWPPRGAVSTHLDTLSIWKEAAIDLQGKRQPSS